MYIRRYDVPASAVDDVMVNKDGVSRGEAVQLLQGRRVWRLFCGVRPAGGAALGRHVLGERTGPHIVPETPSHAYIHYVYIHCMYI